MARSDLAGAVDDALAIDPATFQERVREDAAELRALLDEGAFDNSQAIVGLEHEFYAVTDAGHDAEPDDGGAAGADYGALRRVPRRLLELTGFEKELGLHNAEMTTTPQPLNAHGLAAQRAEVRARLAAAQDCTRSEGIRLVSDGVWTIPPAGETARGYLTDSVEDGGVRIATNMSDAVRYHAMGNAPGDATSGLRIAVPHATLTADTVMPESLITSIQPHYQVAHAADLPERFRYALRVAGPLLALGVNSPFLPPDCYDDVACETVLRDAWMEHRISIFETTLNPVYGPGKVRFPRDIGSLDEAVARVVEDATLVPMDVERGTRFDDAFAHFRRKHGTYWRWVRPVFDGPTRSAANARIEFRPLPAQPTVGDVIAFQAAFAGLMESLPRHEHPVADLDWTYARSNFYDAMREGLDADLRWITNDGRETTDPGRIFDGLLDHAADGLTSAGIAEDVVRETLRPLRHRVEAGRTPASWKHDRVRERVADGDDLASAITGMQRAYIRAQRDTLVKGSFADWD
jgi:hypothetical protein